MQKDYTNDMSPLSKEDYSTLLNPLLIEKPCKELDQALAKKEPLINRLFYKFCPAPDLGGCDRATRPVPKSYENLQKGQLYLASPSSFNDPFELNISFDFIDALDVLKGSRRNKALDGLIMGMSLMALGSKGKRIEEGTPFEMAKKVHLYLFRPHLEASKEPTERVNKEVKDLLFTEGFDQALLHFWNAELTAKDKKDIIGLIETDPRLEEWCKIYNIVEIESKGLKAKLLYEICFEAPALGPNEDYLPYLALKALNKEPTPENIDKNVTWQESVKSGYEKWDCFKNRFGIVSLTTEYQNDLMWAHYASDHRGYCVAYDFTDERSGKPDDLQKAKQFLLPVYYSDETLMVKLSSRFQPDEAHYQEVFRLLTHKKAGWAYEKEWRIIVPDVRDRLLSIRPVFVLLGSKMSPQDELGVLAACDALGIPAYKTTVDRMVGVIQKESVPANNKR